MARPRKIPKSQEETIATQIEKLAAIHCNWREIASVLGYKEDHLRKRFSENFEKGRDQGKMTLKRKQYEVAMSGNVSMLIWLGKQYLDQKDKAEVEDKTPVERKAFTLAYSIQKKDGDKC